MKYLILGAGAAGINGAKTLRELDPEGEITVVSKDTEIYSRCMLHHVISEKRTVADLNFAEGDFFEKYQVAWENDAIAKELDTGERRILLNNGKSLHYDKLLIATGSSSAIPPLKNLREGRGVFGLRNLEDALAIREAAKKVKSAVVLGGGLVGLDALEGLLGEAIDITVVEMANRLLALQLDHVAAKKYEQLFKSKGVNILTGRRIDEVLLDGSGAVRAVKLDDASLINCEMVVVATGVRPNLDFIRDNTIALNRGILINERCETNVRDVYAAGDVCGKNPIWPLAVKGGIVAAHNMAGKTMVMDDAFGLRNSINFFGLETISLGLVEAPDDSYRVFSYKHKEVYKKAVYKDGIIYGAILQGDIAYSGVLTHLIKNKIVVSPKDKDIFDVNYADFFSVNEQGEYVYAV